MTTSLRVAVIGVLSGLVFSLVATTSASATTGKPHAPSSLAFGLSTSARRSLASTRLLNPRPLVV